MLLVYHKKEDYYLAITFYETEQPVTAVRAFSCHFSPEASGLFHVLAFSPILCWHVPIRPYFLDITFAASYNLKSELCRLLFRMYLSVPGRKRHCQTSFD